jgi:hypothetical protein
LQIALIGKACDGLKLLVTSYSTFQARQVRWI